VVVWWCDGVVVWCGRVVVWWCDGVVKHPPPSDSYRDSPLKELIFIHKSIAVKHGYSVIHFVHLRPERPAYPSPGQVKMNKKAIGLIFIERRPGLKTVRHGGLKGQLKKPQDNKKNIFPG